MKKFKYVIFILMTTVFLENAKAADLLELSGSSFTNGIDLSWWNIGSNYKVHWREVSGGSWIKDNDVTFASTDERLEYGINGLDCNTEYEIKVKKKGRIWRHLRLKTKACKVDIPEDAVRIKNMSFGKCIYPHNSGSGTRFHNFDCWADPAFAFIIEPTATINEVKLKSLATGGLCLMPVDDSSYGEITAGSCLSGYAVYEIQDIDVDTFRLRNKLRNKCLYGSSDNGGKVRDFGCWSNPHMVFKFEYY